MQVIFNLFVKVVVLALELDLTYNCVAIANFVWELKFNWITFTQYLSATIYCFEIKASYVAPYLTSEILKKEKKFLVLHLDIKYTLK